MRILFDAAPSNRSFNEAGFLTIRNCLLTKEEVTKYVGREIPGWQALGLHEHTIYPVYRPLGIIEAGKDSFNNVPLVSEHLSITADNYDKDKVIGVIGQDAEIRDGALYNTVVVHDGDIIEKIQSGELKYISCGYYFSVVKDPGTFEGDEYDLKIASLAGQHVAVVDVPRVKDAILADTGKNINKSQEGRLMSTKKKAKKVQKAISWDTLKKLLGLAMDSDPAEPAQDGLDELIAAVREKLEGADDELKAAVEALLAEVAKPAEDEDPEATDEDPEAEVGDEDPEATDEDPEAMDEDPVISKDAMPKLIREITKQVTKSVRAEATAYGEAMDSAQALLGAVDSAKLGKTAESVYDNTLKALGFDSKDFLTLAEKRGAIVAMQKANFKKAEQSIAFDHDTLKALDENPTIKLMRKIRKGG